jgi:hypothetical protein
MSEQRNGTYKHENDGALIWETKRNDLKSELEILREFVSMTARICVETFNLDPTNI